MILTDDRKDLDDALAEDVSICLLLGDEESEPGKVHTCMENPFWGGMPWQRWFLVTDAGLLSDDEQVKWFGDTPENDYAFLGRKSKEVTSCGPAETDLLEDGDCDYLTYLEKFAEADLQ